MGRLRNEMPAVAPKDIRHLVGVVMAGDHHQHLSKLQRNSLPIQLLVQFVFLGREAEQRAEVRSGERSRDPTRGQHPAHTEEAGAGDGEDHDGHPGDRPNGRSNGNALLDTVGDISGHILLEHIRVRLPDRYSQVVICPAVPSQFKDREFGGGTVVEHGTQMEFGGHASRVSCVGQRLTFDTS